MHARFQPLRDGACCMLHEGAMLDDARDADDLVGVVGHSVSLVMPNTGRQS